MSFRMKIGIAFVIVLLLSAGVALISWWGLGRALERQDSLYAFNSELERRFNRMMRSEQAFEVDNKLLHSRAVFNILDDIQFSISNVLSAVSDSRQAEIVQLVLEALKQYEDSFAEYVERHVHMQTMKSRMLRESKRLLTNAEALGREGVDAIEIQQLMTSALLAEKDYMLWEQKAAAERVNEKSLQIARQADAILNKTTNSSIKLKAFRISKVAGVYRKIFNQFVSQQQRLREAKILMHNSLERFKGKLAEYIELEAAITQQSASSSKMLMIIVSLIAVVISIFIAFILSGRITKPINELKQSAGQIRDGNLDASVSISSRDEIGELGSIFNLMAERLKKSFDDIKLYRDHLEDLVKERTLNLEQEVSDRKQAEAALRASEERLSLIIEQSPMGIVSWGTDFTITSWNRASEKIFGYSAGEAIGQHAEFFVPPGSREQVDEVWRGLMAQDGGTRSKNENLTKEGETILCDWYNTPLVDSSGNVIGVLSLVEDVTEREKMEQEVLKVKKLESTAVLAGGIAHDFNNILAAILGNINLSLFDKFLSGKTRELLVNAEKATIRATSLTQQLLTFARGGEPVKESMSLADVVKDSANFVLSGTRVACRYDIPEDLWLVDIDKGQISQVIQNVVLNASHAMPNGGLVYINCTNIDSVDAEDTPLPGDRHFVKITICDNGVGIPANVIDKIFDPYFSTKQEGSGLGLAITHSIVVKHGGHISVKSEPGVGTTVTTYLPASDQKRSIETNRENIARPKKKAKILVMDDDEMVRDVAQGMLTRLGHEVVLANDGQEAIQLFEDAKESAEPIDCVVMDLTIPGGMGGKEAVQAILSIAPEAKVVISSGYSNDPIMASYREYGFSGAVVKPYKLKDLARIVEKVLS